MLAALANPPVMSHTSDEVARTTEPSVANFGEISSPTKVPERVLMPNALKDLPALADM